MYTYLYGIDIQILAHDNTPKSSVHYICKIYGTQNSDLLPWEATIIEASYLENMISCY